MSDYIKREDAIASIMAHDLVEDGDGSREWAEHLLESATIADVVEVVRCKDCKYLKPFTSQYGAGQYCECPCSFGGQGIKKPDDYCSYGERRDDREYNNSILNARKGEE